MRWRSTGGARAMTSSTDGASRPCSSARTRTASISAWLARGPGPQAICSASSAIGLVCRPAGADQAQDRIDHPLADRHAPDQAPAPRSARPRSAPARPARCRRRWSRSSCAARPPRRGSRRRPAAGSGRAAPRAADRCPPARSGSASPGRGRAPAARGRGPATVTRRSCIACSRAAWVRGLARLISSAISSWQNTGPGMKRKLRRPISDSSSTSEPRMSAGIRSGVNCTRFWVSPSTTPSVSTRRVLARPGTPTSSTWPPASSVIRDSSTTRSWPKMARPISARTRRTARSWPRPGRAIAGSRICSSAHSSQRSADEGRVG